MNKLKIRKIVAVGTDARCETDWEDHAGVHLCYVSGVAEKGFDAEQGILVFPEQPHADSYVAIESSSPYWCTPFFGKALDHLPKRVQALLTRKGNEYHYYLPVCDSVFRTVICGTAEGMCFRLSSNCDWISSCEHQLAWVEASGKDPIALFRICAETAADALGKGLKMREERTYPEILEWLGWCSWDAFQIRVNEEGLLQKAEEFREKNVPVQFCIIDDMWADVPNLKSIPDGIDFEAMVEMMHASPLKSFDADPDRFPDGMEGTIEKIKDIGVPHVGIWFPTTGYWKGFLAGGEAEAEMNEHLKETEDGRILVNPDITHTVPYFDTLCGKVASWGGDFVKIDNQGCHQYYKNMESVGKSSESVHQGIETAVEKYFNGALINCMGMPAECMFNRTSSAVCRCSDDFIPENRQWFTKNILESSFNGILQGQYYVNDWDMWWTDDAQAGKNALCRAISGGPIYISDKLGRTRPEILKPVCLSNGRLLRPDLSAIPTADCLTDDPTISGCPFKIFNRTGDTLLLAVLNLDADGAAVNGSFCPAELGIKEECALIYNFFSRTCTVVSSKEKYSITLADANTYEYYWVLPYSGKATVLGCPDFYVGSKAIESIGNNTYRSLEACTVAVYSEKPVRVMGASGEISTVQIQNVYSFYAEGTFKLDCE